jgi:hypothetical protein
MRVALLVILYQRVDLVVWVSRLVELREERAIADGKQARGISLI